MIKRNDITPIVDQINDMFDSYQDVLDRQKDIKLLVGFSTPEIDNLLTLLQEPDTLDLTSK